MGHDVSERKDAGADELPLLHRAAIAYLALPLAIWLLGWFRPWAGLPAAALLAAGLWRALSGSWRPVAPSRITLILLAVALVCVILTPAGGLLLHKADWGVHRAVFLDLARGDWPTYVTDHLGSEPRLLRYYLGWYMPPALAARAMGLAALDWAVPLWTWCGTVLVVMLFAHGLSTVRTALLAVAILFLFSGLDAVDVVLLRALEGVVHPPPSNMYLEYQPHFETFSITPQHFMPAGIASLLLLQLRDHPRFLAVMGIVLTACLFWSTLLSVGLLPLAAAAVASRKRLRCCTSWQNTLAAVPLAGLVALYMIAGEVDFPRAWLWELWASPLGMTMRLALLYTTEFLLLAILVWRLDPRKARDPFLTVSVAVLLAAPLYHYGKVLGSEWSLRFPVPALVILAFHVAREVVRRLPEAPSSRRLSGAHRPVAYWLLVALLAAGAVPAVRSLPNLHLSVVSYSTSGESLGALTDDATKLFFRQRTAHRVPRFLQALLRENNKPAAEAKLAIRSGYDVYLMEPGLLIYRKPDCKWEREQGTWFFLDIRYADGSDRSTSRGHRLPWDEWIVRISEERRDLMFLSVRRLAHYAGDRGCALTGRIPAGDISSVRTGQIGFGGRLMWEANVPHP